MRKLTVANPGLASRSIRAMVKGSDSQLLLHQLHCVLLVAQGRSCREVADWFGNSVRTVERWTCAFNRQGVDGLRPARAHGRPQRISSCIAQRLQFELKHPPCVCGFADTGWTGRLLQQHLVSHFRVSLSLRQSQRILKRLGASHPVSADS